MTERRCQCKRASHPAAAQPTFMMSSGLIVPMPEIPIPALAVPYAAPMAGEHARTMCLGSQSAALASDRSASGARTAEDHLETGGRTSVIAVCEDSTASN